jgi:hypothetical protein
MQDKSLYNTHHPSHLHRVSSRLKGKRIHSRATDPVAGKKCNWTSKNRCDLAPTKEIKQNRRFCFHMYQPKEYSKTKPSQSDE